MEKCLSTSSCVIVAHQELPHSFRRSNLATHPAPMPYCCAIASPGRGVSVAAGSALQRSSSRHDARGIRPCVSGARKNWSGSMIATVDASSFPCLAQCAKPQALLNHGNFLASRVAGARCRIAFELAERRQSASPTRSSRTPAACVEASRRPSPAVSLSSQPTTIRVMGPRCPARFALATRREDRVDVKAVHVAGQAWAALHQRSPRVLEWAHGARIFGAVGGGDAAARLWLRRVAL
eukprot:4612002-Prymnesium_polylepis.1